MKILIGLLAGALMARRTETEPVVASALEAIDLQPAPINPAHVVAGAPFARSGVQSRSLDGAASTCVWDCTDGAFRWHFGWEETVLILEGSVTVTDETGTSRTLNPGDVAYFAVNTWSTWTVHGYVRKLAFCRRADPLPVALVYRMKGVVTDLVRGRLKAA